MKILVLGGSSFFGKKLVQNLVDGGHEVTVATRGNRNFEEHIAAKIRQVIIDRKDIYSMEIAFGKEHFDIIYDQICFNPVEAKLAIDLFTGRVKRYVFTSSMAVYDSTQNIIEERNFDPYCYPIDLTLATYDYKEGKRQAEAFLHQNASFPVVSVRPPITGYQFRPTKSVIHELVKSR